MWSNIQSTVEYTLFSTSLKTMTKSQKKKKSNNTSSKLPEDPAEKAHFALTS